LKKKKTQKQIRIKKKDNLGKNKYVKPKNKKGKKTKTK
jgi:hypothetical protein